LPVAQSILEEWWHVPLHDLRTGHEWPVEQEAFNCHVFPRWHGRIKLIDYRLMNGRDGDFIRHAANEPRDVRARIIREASEVIVGRDGGA